MAEFVEQNINAQRPESPRIGQFSQKHGKSFAYFLGKKFANNINKVENIKHFYENQNKEIMNENNENQNINNIPREEFKNKLDKFNQVAQSSATSQNESLPKGFYDKVYDEITKTHIWVPHVDSVVVAQTQTQQHKKHGAHNKTNVIYEVKK